MSVDSIFSKICTKAKFDKHFAEIDSIYVLK